MDMRELRLASKRDRAIHQEEPDSVLNSSKVEVSFRYAFLSRLPPITLRGRRRKICNDAGSTEL